MTNVRISRALISAGAIAGLALAPLAATTSVNTAFAAVPGTVLLLEFNEPAGSTVAADSSGMGHNGAIGSHIKMNGSYADWDRHPPDAGIYYGAAHLVMVNDAADGSLDPGSSNFTVEFRMRSTDKFGNILQKGQARTAGGQVKFQQPVGFVSCMFKSPTAQRAVKSSIATNDGQWHIIRCERTPSEIRLYIDGVLNKRLGGSTGNINNTKPWTIGGKFECNTSDPTQGADSCDYFPGDIDWIRITKGV
jgi:Concanavalin A-like lectin/glucanases superfamily